MTREELMDHLEKGTQVFKDKDIKAAFHAIDRKDFIESDYEIEAYEDYLLPTLGGQTITKPTTLAFMLELLEPASGHMVLDIGAGSGWTTAILGHMVGKEGKVTALEMVPELVDLAKKNLKKYKELPVEVIKADKETGYYRNAPYDRIIAETSFPDKETAIELMLQLVSNGVMVVPVGDSLFRFLKINDDEFEEVEYPGFIFDSYIK